MPDAYTVTGILGKDACCGLYRAVRQRDCVPVMVKVPRADLPAPREVERLRHEYEILCRLEGSWVPKPYELERQQVLQLRIEEFEVTQRSCRLCDP